MDRTSSDVSSYSDSSPSRPAPGVAVLPGRASRPLAVPASRIVSFHPRSETSQRLYVLYRVETTTDRFRRCDGFSTLVVVLSKGPLQFPTRFLPPSIFPVNLPRPDLLEILVLKGVQERRCSPSDLDTRGSGNSPSGSEVGTVSGSYWNHRGSGVRPETPDTTP